MHDVQPDRLRRPTGGRPASDAEALEVPTERVVPRVSGPAFVTVAGERDGSDAPDAPAVRDASAVRDAPADGEGAGFEVPWAGLPRPGSGVAILAIAAALGMGTSLVADDIRVGLTSMLVVGLAGYVRSVDRHVPFSFGEGFLGYRPDPVWPRGVQEDYDVRWDWRPGPASSKEHRP